MPKLPAWRSTTFSLPATLHGARLRVIRCGAPPSPEGSIGCGPGSLEGSSLRVGSRSDAPASRTQGPPWTHHRRRARKGETWTTLISKNTETVTQSKSKVAASFKIQCFRKAFYKRFVLNQYFLQACVLPRASYQEIASWKSVVRW